AQPRAGLRCRALGSRDPGRGLAQDVQCVLRHVRASEVRFPVPPTYLSAISARSCRARFREEQQRRPDRTTDWWGRHSSVVPEVLTINTLQLFIILYSANPLLSVSCT